MKNTLRLYALTVVAVLSAFTSLRAQVWIDAGDDNYNTSANWSPNVVPGTNSPASITIQSEDPNSYGQTLISLNASPTLTGLTYGTYGSNTVSNALTISATSGNYLTFGSSSSAATIANDSTFNINLAANVYIANNTTVNSTSGDVAFSTGLIFNNPNQLSSSPTLSINAITSVATQLTFDIGSETNGGYSVISLDPASKLTIGSYTNVDFVDSILSPTQSSYTFNLISKGAGSTLTFLSNVNYNFTDLTNPSGYAWNTSNFTTNGTISLNAVPEPSTSDLIMIGCGLLMLFFVVPTVIRRNRVLARHVRQGATVSGQQGSFLWLNEMVDSE